MLHVTIALMAPEAPNAAVFVLTRYDAGMPSDGATYGHATQLCHIKFIKSTAYVTHPI